MVKEFGYEYDAVIDREFWQETNGKVTYDNLWGALCLSSGRDALKVVAREFEPTTVLMPALACDSMVLPFEMYNHKVVYYELNEDYTVDMETLLKKIPNHKALLLYMDYFGKEAFSDQDLNYLKETFSDLVFVEDRTHTLIWDKTKAFIPDYTVASLRKWLNVPDGGLLWSNAPLKNNNFSEDLSFSIKRLEAQCMRNNFFHNGDLNIKQQYRGIFSTVSDILDNDKLPARMSAYAYALARKADFKAIREQRKVNAETLIKILKDAKVDFIQDEVGISDLYVAFKIEDRDYKQSKLSPIGIFNTIIWPLNDEQKSICETARLTEEHMLAAPCDQRYTVDDMKYIGEEMVRVFNG